jgi:cardiolipin synthase
MESMQPPLLRRHRWALGIFALLALLVLLGLAVRSRLPTIVPQLAGPHGPAVQLESVRGPLSAAQSKAILKGVQVGQQTSIFDRHLAREEAIADSPLTTGNQVLLLQDGPATYQAMLAAILAARDHIHMETYILDDDDVGRRFAEALIAMQRQGVQVNLIYDSVGTVGTPKDFFQRLADSGIRTLEFNPMNPLMARREWELNQRDHRKLLIVDGRMHSWAPSTSAACILAARPAGACGSGQQAAPHGATPTCSCRGPWWRNSRSCSWQPGSRRRAHR